MSEPQYGFQLGAGPNFVIRSKTYNDFVNDLNALFGGDSEAVESVLRVQREALLSAKAGAPAPSNRGNASPPAESGSPRCAHGAMVRRTAKTGQRAGQDFWACDGKDSNGNYLPYSEKCKPQNIG